jgi:hypothetical protein
MEVFHGIHGDAIDIAHFVLPEKPAMVIDVVILSLFVLTLDIPRHLK